MKYKQNICYTFLHINVIIFSSNLRNYRSKCSNSGNQLSKTKAEILPTN